MGHANFSNISVVVNQLLKREHGATIHECTEELIKKKQTVHASEGEYDEPFMLSDSCMEIFDILEKAGAITPKVPLSPEQKPIYRDWQNNEIDTWDVGDDGNGGEYAIFDSIRWIALKKKLPRVRYFTR